MKTGTNSISPKYAFVLTLGTKVVKQDKNGKNVYQERKDL